MCPSLSGILHFESDYDDKSDLLSKLQDSTSSFKRMLITSPPVIELNIDDNIVQSQSDGGFTIHALLDSALALSGVDEDENDFEIEGGEACRVLAKTVDEVTGKRASMEQSSSPRKGITDEIHRLGDSPYLLA